MLRLLIVCILMACLPFSQVYAREKEAGDLYLAVADWAYEVRDQGDYDPNPTGRFPKGQMTYAYLELAGFTTAAHGDLYSYHVAVDVGLKTTWGFPLFKQADIIEFDETSPNPPETLWFYIWVNVPRWAPRGTYVTVITVRDELGGYILAAEREIEIF